MKDTFEWKKHWKQIKLIHTRENFLSRVKSDNVDREKIREKLNLCINPLDPTQHPEQLVNVCIGMLGSEKTDVDDAVDIGRRTKEYEKS